MSKDSRILVSRSIVELGITLRLEGGVRMLKGLHLVIADNWEKPVDSVWLTKSGAESRVAALEKEGCPAKVKEVRLIDSPEILGAAELTEMIPGFSAGIQDEYSLGARWNKHDIDDSE